MLIFRRRTSCVRRQGRAEYFCTTAQCTLGLPRRIPVKPDADHEIHRSRIPLSSSSFTHSDHFALTAECFWPPATTLQRGKEWNGHVRSFNQAIMIRPAIDDTVPCDRLSLRHDYCSPPASREEHPYVRSISSYMKMLDHSRKSTVSNTSKQPFHFLKRPNQFRA
jgi:hypothetical protein